MSYSTGPWRDAGAGTPVPPAREAGTRREDVLADAEAARRRVGQVGPLRPGPDPVVRLLRSETARQEAEALGDRRLAAARLGEVVSVLDEILGHTRDHIDDATATTRRARTESAAASDAPTTLARIPLERVADILGLPPAAAVTEVLARLRDHGGVSAQERDRALMEIDRLRRRIREIRPEDPSPLWTIIRQVCRLATAVLAAAAAGALGAALVGDDAVVDLIKGGIAALVTLSVAVGEKRIHDYVRQIDPLRQGRARRDALLGDVDELIEVERGAPEAYRHERTVARIRVVLGAYACRDTLTDVAWAGSATYHAVLAAILDELARDDAGRTFAEQLSVQRRRLAATPLPGEDGRPSNRRRRSSGDRPSP